MTKKRILIIDDDIPLTQLLKINLDHTGQYEVLVENRPTRALSAAHTFRPDLILLDYIMPGLDGGDVSRQFHEDQMLKNVPILMVTALVSNSEIGKDGLVRMGDHVMIPKPFKFDKLKRCIEQQLDGDDK